MDRTERRSSPDYLSVIVALGKRLNSLLHPQEQLYAYCEALMGICRDLQKIYVGFYDEGQKRPGRIYFFDRRARGLMSLGWEGLDDQERRIFERLPVGRKGKESRSRRVMEEPPSPPSDLPRSGARAASRASGARAAKAARGAEDSGPQDFVLLHTFPLRMTSGPECWVLLVGRPGAEWQRRQADRNALSVCADMLAVGLERAILFEKVLHAKKEWERTVDSIRDVVMIVGPDLTVRRANRRVAELARVPVVAMQGRKCYSLLAASGAPCGACPVPGTFRDGKEASAEIVVEGKDAILQCWSYPIADADSGETVAAAVYEKDVTEMKRMQGQLVHAEKMAAIGQLAASVAHELNNPLSAVISISQLLLKEMEPSLPCHEDLKSIEEAALRCKKIVEDLLVFSRKPQVSAQEPVSLSEAVDKAVGLLKARLKVRGIVVEEEIPEGLPGIPIDPDPLQQVLLNLISNARDAMRQGGVLRLKAWQEKKRDRDFVVLSVQDTGCGIPPDRMDKIFEPFYTTKPPGKGTGLGLSICRRLMEAYGGGIEAVSREGRGANFLVWFPLSRVDAGS